MGAGHSHHRLNLSPGLCLQEHEVLIKAQNRCEAGGCCDQGDERQTVGRQKDLPQRKHERILWKKNEVAEYESTTFSIFYNNVLFIATLIVFSFLVFPASTPAVNYVASMGLASVLVALLSTGTGNY